MEVFRFPPVMQQAQKLMMIRKVNTSRKIKGEPKFSVRLFDEL
jgi:hypothetical protein